MRENRREHRRQQRQATINYLSSTIQRQHELYGEIEQDGRFLEKATVVNSPEFHKLTSYFGLLEYLAAAVNMGVFDAEVVNRTIGGRLIRATSDFAEWMEAERQRLGNPAVYEELRELVEDLRRRRGIQASAAPQQSVVGSG